MRSVSSGLIPIALSHAGSGNPDLTHPVGRGAGHRVRIGDDHLLIEQIAAAAHEFARAGLIGKRIEHLVLFQGLAVERTDHRRRRLEAAGNDQGRFGHAIARIERFATKPAGLEVFGKPLDRLGPHRLCAVEGQTPVAQIERGSLLGRDLGDAQVVGEVRPTADRAAIPRDRLQPAERLLQKRHRRQQHVRLADVQRLQDAADQPHVVITGQPEHAAAAARVLEGIRDRRGIVH